jgi:hypothetical protein
MTPQPSGTNGNGFLALAVFDQLENGGNDDGFIDEHDTVYSRLLLGRTRTTTTAGVAGDPGPFTAREML